MSLRALTLSLLLALLGVGFGPARAEKPEKLRVAMGDWKGPRAGSFKSGVRGGLAKDCAFVRAKAARAIIDGEVVEDGKRVRLRVIVKSAKTGEVAEQREFPVTGTNLSQHQAKKIGHDVAEMVRRAPPE